MSSSINIFGNLYILVLFFIFNCDIQIRIFSSFNNSSTDCNAAKSQEVSFIMYLDKPDYVQCLFRNSAELMITAYFRINWETILFYSKDYAKRFPHHRMVFITEYPIQDLHILQSTEVEPNSRLDFQTFCDIVRRSTSFVGVSLCKYQYVLQLSVYIVFPAAHTLVLLVL